MLIILKTISPFFTQNEFLSLHNKKLYVNYSTQGYICKPYKTYIKKEKCICVNDVKQTFIKKFVVSLNYLSVLKNSLIVKVSKQPTLFSKVMDKFCTTVFY